MKRIISLILVFLILSVSVSTFASYSDVPGGSTYNEALTRVTALGIMSGDGNGLFKPNSLITREQFAKIIVSTVSLDDMANTLNGQTIYSDVSSKDPLNGYINEAVAKGFITSLADGKFHPTDAVTYAQVCTAMVKALGYSDTDVPGLWPRNYIVKASILHITEGITLKTNDKIAKWAMAVMLDNLLDVNIKKSSPVEQDKTLAVSVGLTTEGIYTVYSKPEVVKNFNPSDYQIGQISLKDNPTIVRNTIDISTTPVTNNTGEAITISLIKDNDIVYRVSNKANTKSYILIIDNKVSGKVTGILPDKYSPKTIQIDNKNYDLSSNVDINKFNSSSDAINIGDSVTLLVGYDGKVVDEVSTVNDTSNFAFVLDDSYFQGSKLYYTGMTNHLVTLLFTDGSTATYNIRNVEQGFKSKLVTFTKIDDQTVELTEVKKIDPVAMDINKDNRQIGTNDVSSNVKIINFITNSSGKNTQVNLISWNDISSGTLPAGKVLYINKSGPFDDVNLILVNDIFNMTNKTAYVQGAQTTTSGRSTTGTYTLLIDGKAYAYSTNSAFYNPESVIKVSVINGAIDTTTNTLLRDVSGTTIQAIDSKRIKLKDVIYKFKNYATIYYKDVQGKITAKTPYSIDLTKTFSNVSIYLDKPLKDGGKVEVITINE